MTVLALQYPIFENLPTYLKIGYPLWMSPYLTGSRTLTKKLTGSVEPLEPAPTQPLKKLPLFDKSKVEKYPTAVSCV